MRLHYARHGQPISDFFSTHCVGQSLHLLAVFVAQIARFDLV